MTDAAPNTLHDAARHLGISARALRQAIRGGRVPAPPHAAATTKLPPDWLASAKTALESTPRHLTGVRQKVAPFARYEGTSAWRKYRVRVRAYAQFRADAKPAH